VTVPAMNFIAVSGTSDPNDEDGAYKRAVGMLYAVAYTIKMSKKTDRRIDGYFDFVVPPREGFWQQTGTADIDYSRKSDFMWTSVIRLPDFVTAEDFRWAVAEAERKKKLDLSPVEFLTIEEGLCVQCMHLGSYDTEPATVALMHEYAAQQGFVPDLTYLRRHHEIYLSDPRKTVPEKLKTVIRHPVRRKEE
jgi:hypothetical protein